MSLQMPDLGIQMSSVESTLDSTILCHFEPEIRGIKAIKPQNFKNNGFRGFWKMRNKSQTP